MKGLLGIWMSGSFCRAFIVASFGREVTQGVLRMIRGAGSSFSAFIVEIALRVGISATLSSPAVNKTQRISRIVENLCSSQQGSAATNIASYQATSRYQVSDLP